jgi:transposase InsO family protein
MGGITNADTERVMRTIKEDLVWPHEWDFPFELERALKQWIQNYNTDFPHSSLGYLPPEQFEQKHQKTELSSILFAH